MLLSSLLEAPYPAGHSCATYLLVRSLDYLHQYSLSSGRYGCVYTQLLETQLYTSFHQMLITMINTPIKQ